MLSNTSQTVSARRNSAAGVGASKPNVTCRPSLSRTALTTAALSPVDISADGAGGGRHAWRLPAAAFPEPVAAAAGGSADVAASTFASGFGCRLGLGIGPGLDMACLAGGGAIGAVSLACFVGALFSAGLSGAGAAATGTASAGASGLGHASRRHQHRERRGFGCGRLLRDGLSGTDLAASGNSAAGFSAG